MRNIRKLLSIAVIGAGVFLFGTSRSNAQVVGTTGVNPFTGQITTVTSGFNPILNQFGQSSVSVNPLTGQQVGVGISQNPLTGTVYRTDVVRNPWTGAAFTVRQRYNPIINQYRWRSNFRP